MSRFDTVSQAIEAELAKPYKYGVADCFMMGCAIIDSIKGTDFSKKYFRRYTTLSGAQKALHKEGCRNLVGFFRDVISLTQVPAGRCVIGDIGILDLGGIEHVAVFTGNGFLTKTERGAGRFGIEVCKAAFKV